MEIKSKSSRVNLTDPIELVETWDLEKEKFMGLAMDISNVQVSDFGEVVGLFKNLVITSVYVRYA